MSPSRALLAVLVVLSGCTPVTTAAPPLRLVAFDSCAQLRLDLRAAAARSLADRAEARRRDYAESASAAGESAAPAFSGTNVHEQSADEPDVVKTDGRRIVSISGGVLRVVDPVSRRRLGELDLGIAGPTTGRRLGEVDPSRWSNGSDLLLAGDRALVLARGGSRSATAQLFLVDLTGLPTVVSRWSGDGSLLDARQTGSVARVVLQTTPRPDALLPSWTVTTGTTAERGEVGCGQVSRPSEYSGTELLTVLTFDLAADRLGGGDPVSVLADGGTVYGTGTSLYVANGRRFDDRRQARTEIYRFDTAGAGKPVYAAAGTVPGYLINQYALSEWDGRLRVATTDNSTRSSAVRVLQQRGRTLAEVGKVDGLGKGERIFSVRFIEDRGYVVTFRQTDPLYSLDLRDPAQPKVTGELKITGYSSHLQPAGPGRLIGVGQDADLGGRGLGLQVSLFDVGDPAQPVRLDRYEQPDATSTAEQDPHALLWWPATGLLVLPTSSPDTGPTGAVALRVSGDRVDELGTIRQPKTPIPGKEGVFTSSVRRSLMIGDVLWTMSDNGLQALSPSTLEQLAWLPN